MSTSNQSDLHAHLIPRPTLVSALNQALNRRLTLVIGQAGAGKTTLLRQWVAANSDVRFAQLDIEAADDDPAHFVKRLLDAIPIVSPTTREPSVHTSGAGDGDGLGESHERTLASKLGGAQQTVIVLDDVHRFTNVALVAGLGRWIERLPRTVHLVISSRVDPPIALGRLRLNEDLLEFRPAQLAFTEAESAALLELITGRALTTRQVRLLRDRTEGWAAGLQLAGLRLRHETDTDAFIAEFNGSDRLVADYLSEEVIDDLPSDRRRQLLEMSMLDDMCAGLVEAATGCANAQRILVELERESMFLVPLDARREWFRFHHLFSELLRSRLHAENPAAELRILTAAADWHLSRSNVRSALDYLLRAQAHGGAMESMLASVVNDVTTGDSETPLRQFPHSPLASGWSSEDLFAGIRHARSGDSASNLPSSRPAQPTGAAPQRGWGFVAAQVLWRARPDISTEQAHRQLAALMNSGRSGAASGNLADVLVSGGRAHFLAGNTEEARKWLSRALQATASDVAGRVSALSALALVEAWCRNTQEADRLTRSALETARDAGMLALPAIADAYLASVLTALEVEVTAPGDSGQAPPGSRPAPDDIHRAEPHRGPRIQHPLAADRLPLDAASESAAPNDPTTRHTLLFERASASIALGDTESARTIMAAWDDIEPEPTPLSMVQHHILCAKVAAVDDASEESIRELASALRIAEAHNLIEVFVKAGPMILQRLSLISGPESAFSDLIRSRALPEIPVTAVDIAEPLTDRELEILVYLPTRLTNVDLARKFFVSVNTIKTHMAHIYRKLDVTTRDGAIERAREFGLL